MARLCAAVCGAAAVLKVRGALRRNVSRGKPAMIAATRTSSRTRGDHRPASTMSDSTVQNRLLSTILRSGE
jgi:hypothetical protein